MRSLTMICLAMLLLLACSRQLPPPYTVLGKWHQIKKGDTVTTIARAYNCDPHTLAQLNDVSVQGPIDQRTRLFVPQSNGNPPGTGSPAATKDAAPRSPGCAPPERPCLLWPATGSLGQSFGPAANQHHDGIDIMASEGSPVIAASDGTVIYAGDAIKGYGHLVIIRHDNNLITVYAHNTTITVQEGQTVTAGTPIATVGQSGAATEPHLHFEVRQKERPLDPLLYLSPKE